MGLGLVWFANSQVFLLVLILLAVIGAASNVCMVTNRTLLQISCDAPYLGRVMSAYMMMFGMTMLGTMPAAQCCSGTRSLQIPRAFVGA